MPAEVTIDFLKLLSTSEKIRKQLQEHPELTWKMGVEKIRSNYTGEIRTTVIKEVDGILVHFQENKVEILIKPHYLYNDNKHNANDFDVDSCIAILQKFSKRFFLDPSELSVVNVEYGVNIQTTLDIRMLIGSLEYHHKNRFITDSQHAFSKKSASIGANNRFSSYKMIKAYAKCIQYPEYTSGNVFRFEVKSKKSKFINSLGIFSLEDLLHPKKYLPLGSSLKEEFKKVIFLDRQLDTSVYSSLERQKIISYTNPNVWEEFKNLHRNTFLNHKKRYEALASRSSNDIKSALTEELLYKLLMLY